MVSKTSPAQNLTGGQIQEIMDTLLMGILRPLVSRSNLFDTQLVFALSFISKNKKRKISTAGRQESINFLSKALLSEDLEEKLSYIKKARLERSMIEIFVMRIIDENYETFMNLYHRLLEGKEDRILLSKRINVLIKNLGCEKRSDFYILINSLKESLKVYKSYTASVIAQYVKLSSTQAKFFVDTNPHNQYDFNDVRQNFMRNILIALNKYDSSKGALTSYINFWLLNAQTCGSSAHEYGIAYSVPPQHKRKMARDKGSNREVNFSVSLDSPAEDDEGETISLHNKLECPQSVDKQIEHHKTSMLISLLAKNADPYGIGRLSMNIDECFTPQELSKMKNHMVQQGLAKL
jgi:hypothetical protein